LGYPGTFEALELEDNFNLRRRDVKKHKKRKDEPFGFGGYLIVAGLTLFIVAFVFSSKPKEQPVGVLIQQTEKHHDNMAVVNLRIARNNLKGISEGLCEGTRINLELLKEKTQNPEELSKIQQLLEKVNGQEAKTKVMVEEIEGILKEVEKEVD